jgi:hypothetical protein
MQRRGILDTLREIGGEKNLKIFIATNFSKRVVRNSGYLMCEIFPIWYV